jgi:hypothetical protein
MPAVILGNGPSLRGFNFVHELEGFDTFGMNAAYRYWDIIGWYPTYYACTDPFVAQAHKGAIRRLMRNRNTYGIQAFFLCMALVRVLGKDGALPCVNVYPFWLIRNNFLRIPSLRAGYFNVGSISLLWAAALGYRRIILLGIDADFPVPILREGHVVNTFGENRSSVKIDATPKHNPNYFIDDYQQKGDIYGQSFNADDMHKRGWHNMPEVMRDMGIHVVNANPASKIDGFQKCTWEDAKYTFNI